MSMSMFYVNSSTTTIAGRMLFELLNMLRAHAHARARARRAHSHDSGANEEDGSVFFSEQTTATTAKARQG